jgi:hypothetical protein
MTQALAALQASSAVVASLKLDPTAVIGPASAASAANLAGLTPFTPDALANGMATLVGALLGATLAYVLQRRMQARVEERNALTSAHRLMFALLQQINTIVLIQRDYVHEHLDNPGRFISIPATPMFDTEKNILQVPDLSFLIDSKDGRAVMYDFYLAQENYIEALNQWNLRSAIHFGKVQPALAASTIPNGGLVTQETIELVLGTHLFGTIVSGTNNCLEALQRAYAKLAEVKIKARAYLVQRFKTNDFTDFDMPETYGLVPITPPPRSEA